MYTGVLELLVYAVSGVLPVVAGITMMRLDKPLKEVP
jgi:hypothetical protein